MAKSGSKRQKDAIEAASDDTDRISKLSDSLLCHILSFLTTREAVATSILSNRWKLLWLSVPVLHFINDKRFLTNTRFIEFVYTILVSRDSQPIKSFLVDCKSSSCPSNYNLNAWVNTAIRRNVEQLELSLPWSKGIRLPSRVFTCATLVVLKLKGLNVKAPSYVLLPSLKILHLEGLQLSQHTSVAKLISGCAILEELVINSVETMKEFVRFRVQRLPKLVTADIQWFLNFPFKAIYNVEFLRTRLYVHRWYELPTFHKLVHLELIFYEYRWDSIIKLLRKSPKLQILVIHKEPAETIEKNWKNPRLVPSCLSSHLRLCYLGGFEGHECELQLARYIMENATVLLTLKIFSSSNSNSDAKLEMMTRLSSCPRISPKCQLIFE